MLLCTTKCALASEPVADQRGTVQPEAIQPEAIQPETIQFSYTACSNITSEHLTILQLYQRGVPQSLAVESLPRISKTAKKRVEYIYDLARQRGLLNTYSDINTNYARCATLVHKHHGIPAPDQNEYAFYFCAGENKRRFEIILHSDRSADETDLLAKTPPSHHGVAKKYYHLIRNKGLLAAFDYTANNLKACLNNQQRPF